jgi:Methyltransferase domain
MNQPKNLWLFLRLLLSNPTEFFDRAEVVFLGKKEEWLKGTRRNGGYPNSVSWDDGVRSMSAVLGRDLAGILDEPEFYAMLQRVGGLTQGLKAQRNLPFPTGYIPKSTILRLVYLLCRALEPETVVETGVAFGASSAVILTALHKNRKGFLHSIDLPPIGARGSDAQIGMMVPLEYRDRWQLHLGPSKRVLPRLFHDGVSNIGLFVHDSATLYEIQRMELKSVWRHMSPSGAIIANRIDRNTAFEEFTQERQVDHWFAVEEPQKHLHRVGLILAAGAAARTVPGRPRDVAGAPRL